MLWLWHRPAAVALIRPLAQELPYATGAALKKFFLIFFSPFGLFRATPAAYGDFQARGQIGAVAAGLYRSHSNTRPEPCLQPQLMATLDP